MFAKGIKATVSTDRCTEYKVDCCRPPKTQLFWQPKAQFCERVLGRAILGHVRRTGDDFETVGRRSNVAGPT